MLSDALASIRFFFFLVHSRSIYIQISRIALLGGCLFSAGHDGQVNQYMLSYPGTPTTRLTCAANRAENLHHPASTRGGKSSACWMPSKATPSSPKIPYYEESHQQQVGGCLEQAAAVRNISKCTCGSSFEGLGFKSCSSQCIPQPPLMVLTLVTCYATAPVTAISDLWVSYNDVGGGRDDTDAAAKSVGNKWKASSRRVSGGGKVHIVVAGRSGSSRMAVWDLTEGRQLLEVFVYLYYFSCRYSRLYLHIFVVVFVFLFRSRMNFLICIRIRTRTHICTCTCILVRFHTKRLLQLHDVF